MPFMAHIELHMKSLSRCLITGLENLCNPSVAMVFVKSLQSRWRYLTGTSRINTTITCSRDRVSAKYSLNTILRQISLTVGDLRERKRIASGRDSWKKSPCRISTILSLYNLITGAAMIQRIRILFGLSLLQTLNACTDLSPIPTVKELDWNPPRISVTGCPDLSGRYIGPDAENYRWLFPSYSEKYLYSSHEIYLRDRELDIHVTVESRTDGIHIQADNGRNHVESFTPYDGVMVGCHDGVLVSRFLSTRHGGGAESGACSSFTYGERRTKLNRNGDIEVVYNQRIRCGTFGSFASLPPTEDNTMGPYVFRRVQAAPPPTSP